MKFLSTLIFTLLLTSCTSSAKKTAGIQVINSDPESKSIVSTQKKDDFEDTSLSETRITFPDNTNDIHQEAISSFDLGSSSGLIFSGQINEKGLIKINVNSTNNIISKDAEMIIIINKQKESPEYIFLARSDESSNQLGIYHGYTPLTQVKTNINLVFKQPKLKNIVINFDLDANELFKK